MRRLGSPPRPDWQAKVEKIGLSYHTHRGEDGTRSTYWNEEACYEFTEKEILELERVSKELHHLLIDAADHVVTSGCWDLLEIPAHAIPLIERSWNADDFSLYGRFDFAAMPGQTPKVLEYNADTPTALVEAALAQWFWLQECHPGKDQFNSLHERLIAAWKRYATLQPGLAVLDFTAVEDDALEDRQTISYLMDTAIQAGFRTRWTPITELGYDKRQQVFVGADRGVIPSEPIVSCFKLYPWEFMLKEEFARYLPNAPTTWIEPPWKALLSNKAILAIAWEKNPRHPNLLPCYFTSERLGNNYVRKPKWSREGANIRVIRNGRLAVETDGDYGSAGFIYQEIADIPDFDGNQPVIGSWIVDHEPAGMGIRESDGMITGNLSRFVPHYFVPA
jgi:glutathionylspermidine synthase